MDVLITDIPELRAMDKFTLCAVFGDLTQPPPEGTRQVLVYKHDAAETSVGGFNADVEGVYLTGPWPTGIAKGWEGNSSVITGDVLRTLISRFPEGSHVTIHFSREHGRLARYSNL